MRGDTPIFVSIEPPNNLAARTRPPVLLVEHLTKRFGDRLAVDDVSFSVTAGEVFGFLGPNGAGKTTTVRMLATLISPSSGSAIVAVPLAAENGLEIRHGSPSCQRTLGCICACPSPRTSSSSPVCTASAT